MDDVKFRNRYRIPSARLATWDYGSNAAYFITICTQDRVHVFGAVRGGQMDLSPLGQAAWDCWDAIPDHFPFVIADAFVAMPNHVHGIIIIDKPGDGGGDGDGSGRGRGRDRGRDRRDAKSCVSTPPPPPPSEPPGNRFGPQSQNLASIVRGFKIGVTLCARRSEIAFAWQPRYHDHVIRDAGEYDRIRSYIIANPARWQEDRFHAAG